MIDGQQQIIEVIDATYNLLKVRASKSSALKKGETNS